MKHFKHSFLTLVFLVLAVTAYSQSIISDLKVEFKLEDAASTTLPNVLLKLELSDTANVNAIVLTLGSTNGGSEFLSYSVNLNGSNLPQGVTLSVTNNKVVINTGRHSGVIRYYATAKLQYANGSYSSVATVNNVE